MVMELTKDGAQGRCRQPWLHATCDAFSETATGFLGTKRKTMLDNPLLYRNPHPGKSQKLFSAPEGIPRDFTYGTNYRDFFNMSQALTGWTEFQVRQEELGNKKLPDPRQPDFLSMNRAAVSHGMTSAKELRDFRETHEITRSDLNVKETSEVKPAPLVVDKNKTYGKPRPCHDTTIQRLLSTHYQDEWIRSLPVKPDSGKELFKLHKPKYDYTRYYNNRTCDLRAFMPKTKVEDKVPLWRMPKFTRHAKPALSTFRSQTEADKAWRNSDFDRVGRQGTEGQGITIAANNHIDWLHCD